MNLLRITDPQIASPTVSPANRINKVLTQNPFMPRQQSRSRIWLVCRCL